jgi:hypothetical protein
MTDEPAQIRAADIETEAARAAVQSLTGGGSLADAARAAIAVADRMLDDIASHPEVAQSLAAAACGPGCGWCCHQVVGITTAEEDMVAAAVAALPDEARARFRQRVAEAHKRLDSLPVGQWQGARVPCPALEDAHCTIHADRPLPCRAVLSNDADICRRWLEGDDVRIPLLAVPRRVYSLAQSGLAQALAATGTPPGPMALVEALALILD